MVLKLAILVTVVLCFYAQNGAASTEYQFETCKRIKNTRTRYIGYLPKNNKVGCLGCRAYVACDQYHILTGQKYTECQPDGTWKPALGGCHLKPEYKEVEPENKSTPSILANLIKSADFSPPIQTPRNFALTKTCPSTENFDDSIVDYMDDILDELVEQCFRDRIGEGKKRRRNRRRRGQINIV